jgi:hypothetical protein
VDKTSDKAGTFPAKAILLAPAGAGRQVVEFKTRRCSNISGERTVEKMKSCSDGI